MTSQLKFNQAPAPKGVSIRTEAGSTAAGQPSFLEEPGYFGISPPNRAREFVLAQKSLDQNRQLLNPLSQSYISSVNHIRQEIDIDLFAGAILIAIALEDFVCFSSYRMVRIHR